MHSDSVSTEQLSTFSLMSSSTVFFLNTRAFDAIVQIHLTLHSGLVLFWFVLPFRSQSSTSLNNVRRVGLSFPASALPVREYSLYFRNTEDFYCFTEKRSSRSSDICVVIIFAEQKKTEIITSVAWWSNTLMNWREQGQENRSSKQTTTFESNAKRLSMKRDKKMTSPSSYYGGVRKCSWFSGILSLERLDSFDKFLPSNSVTAFCWTLHSRQRRIWHTV